MRVYISVTMTSHCSTALSHKVSCLSSGFSKNFFVTLTLASEGPQPPNYPLPTSTIKKSSSALHQIYMIKHPSFPSFPLAPLPLPDLCARFAAPNLFSSFKASISNLLSSAELLDPVANRFAARLSPPSAACLYHVSAAWGLASIPIPV